jgi:hypothetical protein
MVPEKRPPALRGGRQRQHIYVDSHDVEVWQGERVVALLKHATLSWPKCDTCGHIMRLVGLEPHVKREFLSVHTYKCSCGETSVVEVAHM